MKKFACKISALLCAAAMLTALLPAFGVSAAAQTKKFLDPMEDSAFPKAYSVKTILPANYDVTEAQVKANGGVFGANSDKRALAAFKTNKTMKLFKEVFGNNYSRTHTLMKNYVACELELIYEFKNGFKDFEFMGIAGAGNWAGAWGMEENPPLEIAYSNTATGGWKTLNYKDMRDMPAAEGSTYCYFRGKSIPTSARYLRIRFLNGADYDSAKNIWEPRYENWACALGYLLVNEYTAPQSGGSASGSNAGTSSVNNGGGNTTSQKPNGTSSADNTSSTASVTTSENNGTATESNPENNGNSPSDDTVVDVKTDVKREIDWKITGIIIGADVLVVGGVIAVLILLYKKKVRELIIK